MRRTEPSAPDPDDLSAADSPSSRFQAALRVAEELYLSDPASAAERAAQALAALGDAAGPQQHARAAQVRAFALGLLGDTRQALQELQGALQRLEAARQADAAAVALEGVRAQLLRSLSIANDQLGDMHEALTWGLQAIEAARTQADPLLLADCLQSVGIVRARLGDHDTALTHQLEALAMFEAGGVLAAMISALCNIGIACKNLGRPGDAVEHLQRALQLARSTGDEGMVMNVAANLPEPLRQLGRLEEALQFARQAQAHMHAAGIAASECHCQLQLGLCLQALGDADGARNAMAQALALAQRSGPHARHHLPRVHAALHALHKGAGQFELALQHHEAFHAAERALFNAESARSLNALQVRFDLERARHEADLERLRAAELAALSQTDALTGLANRRHLDQRLAQEALRAQRLRHPLALAIIDIDNFKQVNDRHGHPLGDVVLQQVAQLLRQHCRGVDLCARYGGEEFCIVFVEAHLPEAQRACEALRAAVAAHDWPALAAGLQITLSIGVAVLEPEDARGNRATPASPAEEALAAPPDGIRALLAAADQQLYTAKRDGKNRVQPRVYAT